MSIMYELLDLARNMADILIVALFCRSLPRKDTAPWKKRLCIAALLVLQLIFFCFINDTAIQFNGRMILRIFSTIMYIAVFKKCRFWSAVYISLLLSVCVTGCHNIFMAPYLRDYRIGAFPVFANPQLNAAFCRTSIVFFDFAVIGFVSTILDLSKIHSGSKFRIVIAASLLTIELFVKHMLKLYSDNATYGVDLMMFAVIVSTLTVALIVLYEHFILVREQKAEQEQIALSQRYAYESAMNSYRLDLEVRRLHHDMKNHLTALHSLCGDDTRLRAYLENMGSTLEAYESNIDTGSSAINGLLGDKIRQAQKLNLNLQLAVDLSDCQFLSDSDLCIILGNILDNALEAASHIDASKNRIVSLKIGTVSDAVIIRCTNSFYSELDFSGDLPVTSKADKKHHGLGLLSVKQVVQRHNGYLSINHADGQFTITIMFPINKEQGKGV